MKKEKQLILSISTSVFFINLLVVSISGFSTTGVIGLIILLLVTGPLFVATLIAALLRYNKEEQKNPLSNLLMWVFIIFGIIIFLYSAPTIFASDEYSYNKTKKITPQKQHIHFSEIQQPWQKMDILPQLECSFSAAASAYRVKRSLSPRYAGASARSMMNKSAKPATTTTKSSIAKEGRRPKSFNWAFISWKTEG